MAQQDLMVRFQNDNIATSFLTEDQIRQRCPLAYTEVPTNQVSDKYVLANTSTVISDMEKLGWKVVQASQRKGREGSSGRFSYHMVVFQNPEIYITKTTLQGEEVDCYPRIILTNSHDGLNCFRFMVGLYRLVCSNGLVIASEEFSDLKIRHIHYTFEELQNLTNKVISELPAQVELMTQMKNRELTMDERRNLAIIMYKIRKGVSLEDEVELTIDEETVVEMLDPVREEDKATDLWTVFNVLQEKIVKGGYKYFEQVMKRPREMRRIKSFVKDLDINRKMFLAAKALLVGKDSKANQEAIVVEEV